MTKIEVKFAGWDGDGHAALDENAAAHNMTLRDHMAGHALQGILTSSASYDGATELNATRFAYLAYCYAIAMEQARAMAPDKAPGTASTIASMTMQIQTHLTRIDRLEETLRRCLGRIPPDSNLYGDIQKLLRASHE